MRKIFFLTLISHLLLSCSEERPGTRQEIYTSRLSKIFSFSLELILPGRPEYIYDNISGDISGWWDHSFSENPARLYIEAKPGGGFWEIFDDGEEGILHARVIYAQRGKKLRFTGPLGLSGLAVNMVHTYTFSVHSHDSTKLVLDVHGSGEIEEDTPVTVEKVWRHFLFERFKPYIENMNK